MFSLPVVYRRNRNQSRKKWATAWQNQQNDMCAQRRLRSAWASNYGLIANDSVASKFLFALISFKIKVKSVRLSVWAAPSEFGTYRLCEQRRFRRACAFAQSRLNLRCSLIQAVSQEDSSDRKPDPCPLWMAGHAQLIFVMTECSKTQIRLTRPSIISVKQCKIQLSPVIFSN